MAAFDRKLSVLLLVVVCYLISVAYCAKKLGVAREEDIQSIKCQVCEKFASQLYHHQIQAKRKSEYQMKEIAVNVCDLKKQEADWILKIDVVEQGDRLELVEKDSKGQCDSECKTIERACKQFLRFYDTDAAEYIYRKKLQLDSLTSYICEDLTEACSPKDTTPGEPFVAKSEKEAEMERLMKSMEGVPGAPGMTMYSREDLMNKKIGDEDAEDEDDDDDDDDEGNVPREKDSKKYGWKDRLRKGVVDAGKKLKGGADKVSNKIKRLWRSMQSSKSGKAEL